jgi:hypothetical protein
MAVRLTDLRARAGFTPRKVFWYSFLLEAGWTPWLQCGLEGVGKLKKIQYLHRDDIHCDIPRNTRKDGENETLDTFSKGTFSHCAA